MEPAEAAQAFVACFDEPGFLDQVARSGFNDAGPRAAAGGFPNAIVVATSEERGADFSVAVTLFESAEMLASATQELDLDFSSLTFAETDEVGAAVVTWSSEAGRTELRDSVNTCLGG